VHAYWWNALPNWGDKLNWTLLTHLDAAPAWRSPADAELVVVGSVLEHLPKGWSGTVCGAGKLHEHSDVDLSNARVLAVRGKLTAKAKGVPKDVVLGDPGLLVPYWIRQWPAKYELGIVPHWSDTELAERFPHGHVIDITQRPEDVVSEIAKCKRIVSSSLHGIIVADAYGIPRQAELFPQAAKEGGDFKFRDYASVYDTHPHFGEMWRAPHHIVERIQGELSAVLEVAVGREQPSLIPDPKTPTLRNKRCPQISLLVPFRDDGEHRSRVWDWLRRYWMSQLDSVEIIQGFDSRYPFAKSVAVNNAAEKARGRVFVILDADAYLDAKVVQHCADEIDKAVRHGKRKWFMPYSRLFRLNRETTYNLLQYEPPCLPYDVPSPPPADWLEHKQAPSYGHQYGAMVQIMPREAFFEVRGMENRMRGWGGEDVSMLRALDTLYCQHENTPNDVLHLWHDRPGSDWKTRKWVGQSWSPANSALALRYSHATGEPGFMRQVVSEHVQPKPRRGCWLRWLGFGC
jgi:hypothetical protein